jgi:hypothetical protein
MKGRCDLSLVRNVVLVMSISGGLLLMHMGLSWACVDRDSQAAMVLAASVPYSCYGCRPRLLPHPNVPHAFSAVLPSFAYSRPFPTTADGLYLTGTNALGFPQLRPKHYRVPQHP